MHYTSEIHVDNDIRVHYEEMLCVNYRGEIWLKQVLLGIYRVSFGNIERFDYTFSPLYIMAA